MTRLGGVLGSPFSPRASWRKSCRLPRTGCHRHTPSLGAYLNSRPAGLHSRFGRDCRNPAITMIFDAPSTLGFNSLRPNSLRNGTGNFHTRIRENL